MLLLVTGASGVGKSTVRRILEPKVAPEVECVELADLSPRIAPRDLAWRHRTTNIAAQHAAELQHEGRHLLLCGDPVAAIELIAVPASAALDAIAVCLLDASPDAQAARLSERGDASNLLVHHHAFAEWMRQQATDPMHTLEVVTTNGWSEMRWDRIPHLAAAWSTHVIDTTTLSPADSAAAVLTWLRAAISGAVPALRVAD